MAKKSAKRTPEFLISGTELILLWRQLKVDLYWEDAIPRKLAIVGFERHLIENLEKFQALLAEAPESIATEEFLGEVTIVPKSYDTEGWDCSSEPVFSEASRQFEHFAAKLLNSDSERDRPRASFRAIAIPSINFQLLGFLWCKYVGAKLDGKFLSEHCRANRIRRETWGDQTSPPKMHSVGLFIPYIGAYRDWRKDGLRAIRHHLTDESGEPTNDSVVAVTMDVSSFYPNIDPSFLLDDQFISELNKEEVALHQKFVHCLQKWARRHNTGLGIPIGLVASKMVANLCLASFDSELVKTLNPIYYGRYVDDIFLVVRPSPSVESGGSITDWLIDVIPCLSQAKSGIRISNDLKGVCNSDLTFGANKQRSFHLQGASGLDVLEALTKKIDEVSSEYRIMPDADDIDSLSRSVLAFDTASSEDPDSLRKIDSLSVRRLGLSMSLRSLELFERMFVESSEWLRARETFYDTVRRHVLVPHRISDYWRYSQRVIALAVSNGDWGHAASILREFVESLRKFCGDLADEFKATRELARRHLEEEIAVAFCDRQGSEREQALFWLAFEDSFGCPLEDSSILRKLNQALSISDLGRRPIRDYLIQPHIGRLLDSSGPSRELLWNKLDDILHTPTPLVTSEYRLSINPPIIPNSKHLFAGLFLSIFPPSAFHVDLIAGNGPAKRSTLKRWMTFTRGHNITRSEPENDRSQYFKFPWNEADYVTVSVDVAPTNDTKEIRIGLTSYLTKEDVYRKRVEGHPDLSSARQSQLATLLKSAIREKDNLDYLVLPELSLPPEWLLFAAQYLAQNRISLIAGCEYENLGGNAVANPAYACLTSRDLGYPTFRICRQDKATPAFHEEALLSDISGLELQSRDSRSLPVFFDHKNFRFGILVCSDFTDIRRRSIYAGHVDAIFAIEWNKDTGLFSPIVESASTDLHCFIVQCNNRCYGDSRIQQPAKRSFNNEIVRVRGGENDQLVIGRISVGALRHFQSHKRSPDGEHQLFKPVPPGFSIDASRRAFGSNGDRAKEGDS